MMSATLSVVQILTCHACTDVCFFSCMLLFTSVYHACMLIFRQMIDNTWAWAKANNKLIKHPINGAEYVSCDIERLKKRVEEEGSRISSAATGDVQAPLFPILTHTMCDICFPMILGSL